jgi:hypothetical protein
MDRGLAYLQKIHDAVRTAASSASGEEEIAQKTAAALGLPPQVVTPLFVRTIGANLRALDCRDLLSGE